MSIVIGLLVAVAAVLLVLDPILRPHAVRPAELGILDEPEDDPREHRKELALAALKEIEFDRETGKLSDADYQSMLTRYTKEAVEALREAEPAVAGDGQAAAEPAGAAGDDPIERLIAQTRAANQGRRFCIACGAALEGSGRFCVECGTPA